MTHVPHPHIENRKKHGVHTVAREHAGFNGWLAVKITNGVATMWCAYAFTILALISLPEAIKGGTATLIAWIAQTFLQLVLLSIIMVGQKVAAAASDKQAFQTFKDAEALLDISNDLHKLLKANTALTEEIHARLDKKGAARSAAPGSQADAAKPPRRRTAATT
jgi:hypothetical protein